MLVVCARAPTIAQNVDDFDVCAHEEAMTCLARPWGMQPHFVSQCRYMCSTRLLSVLTQMESLYASLAPTYERHNFCSLSMDAHE
jgi:hypothetical protein